MGWGRSLDGTTNFATGIPYWAIFLARLRGSFRCWRSDVPAPPATDRADAGQGALAHGKTLLPPSHRMAARSVAPRSAAFLGVCRAAGSLAFPARFRPAGCGQPQSGQRAMGQTVAALEAPEDLGSGGRLAGALRSLGLPFALVAEQVQKPYEPGAHLATVIFPVLAAKDPATRGMCSSAPGARRC